MDEIDARLRALVEEGVRAARHPAPARLRRRAHRRRARRTAATGLLTLAAVALALALPVRPHAVPRPAAVLPIDAVRAVLAADPLRAAPGGQVTVAGTRCDPGTSVFLALGTAEHPRELATITADRTGSFTATVRIPPTPRPARAPCGRRAKPPTRPESCCRAPPSTSTDT